MTNMSVQERFYDAVLGYKPFYETTMNLSLEYDIQLRQEHINNIENRTKQLNAHLHISSNIKGTTTIVKVNYKK